MCLLRVRLTMRQLMAGVAILALVFGGVVLYQRSAHLLEIAVVHAMKSRKPLDYHRVMSEKYMRAASYPWRPVEPDLPEPGGYCRCSLFPVID